MLFWWRHDRKTAGAYPLIQGPRQLGCEGCLEAPVEQPLEGRRHVAADYVVVSNVEATKHGLVELPALEVVATEVVLVGRTEKGAALVGSVFKLLLCQLRSVEHLLGGRSTCSDARLLGPKLVCW